MWNLAVSKPVPGPEVEVAIASLEFEGEAAPHVIEQIEAAKEAAKTLFASGAVGPVDDPEIAYHVGLSGHANPDHKPTPGYENDTLTVHVIQAGKVAVEEEPAPAPATPAPAAGQEATGIDDHAPAEGEPGQAPPEGTTPPAGEPTTTPDGGTPAPAAPEGEPPAPTDPPAETAEPKTPPVPGSEGAAS